jgi:hypothetical protein
MNNKPTCHPDTPESGQQKLRFFNPIRYEMTATLTHKSNRAWRRLFSAKATKRRERRKQIKQMTYKLNRK